MKVYVGKNLKGIWKASFDYNKVSRYSNLMESDLPVVHDKVYILVTYNGYDYDYSTGRIYDVYGYDGIFHSVSELKKSKSWKIGEKFAKEQPDKYHVTPFSIVSDDMGEPFCYGDVMQRMFAMRIIGIRVYP